MRPGHSILYAILEVGDGNHYIGTFLVSSGKSVDIRDVRIGDLMKVKPFALYWDEIEEQAVSLMMHAEPAILPGSDPTPFWGAFMLKDNARLKDHFHYFSDHSLSFFDHSKVDHKKNGDMIWFSISHEDNI